MIIYLCNNPFDISWISRTSIYCGIGITTLSPFLKSDCRCLVILVSESACVCCPDNVRLWHNIGIGYS